MKCPRCGENTPDSWQTMQYINKKRDGGSETGSELVVFGEAQRAGWPDHS